MRSLPARLVLKEGRALAPIWLATAASIVASARIGMPLGGLFAFVLGAVALGVFSIGHEYAHRTLTSLLAQPLSRARLLLSKVVVLAPLLALLTLLAANLLQPGEARWRLTILLLTPVLGLCIAPWLTMMCRSAIGGLVFTLAVPAGLWIIGQIMRVVTVGFMVDPLAYNPARTLMIAGLVALSVVAVVSGRSMFARLEALDAPLDIAPGVMTPLMRADADAVAPAVRTGLAGWHRRHPLIMLAPKEIRLQPLAFAVAALYALGWIVMRLTRTDAYIAGQSFQTVSELYGVLIAMLVGAVATAEERALGTAESQILQPWAYWKQWTTKLATVGTLALVLGLAMPIALERAFPLIGDSGHAGLRRMFGVIQYEIDGGPLAVLLVAFFSCYVSTLCAGGLRALLLALPLSFGLFWLYRYLEYSTFHIETAVLSRLYPSASGYPRTVWWRDMPTATPTDVVTLFAADRWINTITFASFVVLILALALRNSRSAERGTTVAWRQLTLVATSVALAAIIGRAAPAFLQWWLFTH